MLLAIFEQQERAHAGLEAAVMGDAGAVRRQVQHLHRVHAPLAIGDGAGGNRHAQRAVVGAPLLGDQGLERRRAIDRRVELDAAAAAVSPGDPALDRDGLRKLDRKRLAGIHGHARLQHHAVVRNVADPPEAHIVCPA